MRVLSPVPSFTGVVAGVAFAHGEAETTSAAALQYFARHGYHIGVDRPPSTDLTAEAIEQIEAYGGTVEVRDGEQVVVIPAAVVNAELAATPDVEQAAPVPLERPSDNASTEAWATYAVSRGADPDTAAALKRGELIANYGQEA